MYLCTWECPSPGFVACSGVPPEFSTHWRSKTDWDQQDSRLLSVGLESVDASSCTTSLMLWVEGTLTVKSSAQPSTNAIHVYTCCMLQYLQETFVWVSAIPTKKIKSRPFWLKLVGGGLLQSNPDKTHTNAYICFRLPPFRKATILTLASGKLQLE